ncbi:hypothetical protein NOJ05_13665 [Neorhizobium galegae]|uniref:hypothetical protein n=1 Tax=Neorhizobium galegae TaxID=399 RepID=UPI0021056C87|nr:hypothetical protein [Neorhizobium galegae]MCQ1778250.1 hypothetical protein [Neorhizobium galegae]MCQ1796776.1 hypothetical protein [Neorhizobium galegae]
MIHPQHKSARAEKPDFEFSSTPRVFPAVDALRLLWPASAAAASEMVEEWKDRAGAALGKLRLCKDTMLCIASHTSRKTGVCTLSNQALSTRSHRKIDATKKDITRLKKMGYLIAETDLGNGYRNRTRSLILAIPDRIDDDKRILTNDDKRIPRADDYGCGYTHPPYVYPIDQGERRDV